MMGLSAFDLAIMAGGAISLLIWLLFYFKGKQYNDMFENLEEKTYPLKEIYGFGYAFLETIHYNYRTKSDRKLRAQLEILYTPKYSEYYLRVVRSQQITIASIVFVISFAMYGLSSEIVAFIVCLSFSALAFYYFGTETGKKIQKRSDELLHDFSDVVSKIALLTNAGMIIGEAWETVAYGGEGEIYKEMRLACESINTGTPEIDAYYEFGNRCIIPEIKKFSSTIIQGLINGNAALAKMLQDQSAEVWALKKQLTKREGEKAASKLLIPISIMFLGILIIIVVPIFTNIGM